MLGWALLVGALLYPVGLYGSPPVGLYDSLPVGLYDSLPLGQDDSHVLDVPYRSQLDGSSYALSNCGPTALAMVLAYYGIDASPADLRIRAMQAQHSWIDDEGGYSDSYGVFVYNLASVAEGMGLHSTGLWDREGVRDNRLREWHPSDLRREIQADRPVIVEVTYNALPSHAGSRAPDDHYIVVHGTVGADFVYSDPISTGGTGPDQLISEPDLAFAMSETLTPRVAFGLLKPRLRYGSGP